MKSLFNIERRYGGEPVLRTTKQRIMFIVYCFSIFITFSIITVLLIWMPYWIFTGNSIYKELL